MLFRKHCRHLRPYIYTNEHVNTFAYIHLYIDTFTHPYTHTHIHAHMNNLSTKKEMHASYTVISMISTFAIKRFAMYLYIIHIHIIISIMPLS